MVATNPEWVLVMLLMVLVVVLVVLVVAFFLVGLSRGKVATTFTTT